jgi:hypothetical protein
MVGLGDSPGGTFGSNSFDITSMTKDQVQLGMRPGEILALCWEGLTRR